MKLTPRDFLLLAIVVYFTFIGGTFYSQLNLFLRVTNQIVVTGLLGGWLAVRLKQGHGLPRTPLDAAWGLYLLAGLAGAVLGQSPRFSFEALWLSLSHVLAFYLLVDVARRGGAAKLVWAFYMAAAVVCLVGLAEFAAWYVGAGPFSPGWLAVGGWRNPIPPVMYRLNITLNGSTPLANYLSLLITPAAALWLSLPRRDANRRALLVVLALAVVVLLLAFSRTGLVGTAVSLLLLLAGWLAVAPRGVAWRQKWIGLKRREQAAALLLLLAVLLLTGGWAYWAVADRPDSIDFRFTLWATALRIFKANWLTGVGPGNFGRALLRLNEAALPRQQIGSAHNLYLNTAAELGLAGLAAGAYLYWQAARSWAAHWRQLAEPAAKIRLIGLGATLVGLAVQLLADCYAATPNILIMMALLAAVVAPLKVDRPSRLKTVPAYLAAAALLLGLAAWGWVARADWHAEASFRRERAGDLPAAIAQAEQAYRLDPALALRAFRLGLLQARLAGTAGQPAALRAAIAYYQQGLAQEPIWGLNSANLAGLLWQNGQPAEAVDWLTRSLQAEANPQYALNLGYFYEQQGHWEQAGAAYGQALRLWPDMAASGFWLASPGRAARWPGFVAAAGNRQLAAAIEQVRRETDDDPAATESALKTAVFQGDGQAYYQMGRLYERQGNPVAAQAAYRQALVFAQPESIEVIIYGRLGGNDLSPQLIRAAGAAQIKPALALIRLYGAAGQPDQAASIYKLMAGQDSFFPKPGARP